MNPRTYLLIAALVVMLLSLGATGGRAENPFYFKHGAWLCSTPEAYPLAVEATGNLGGRTFEELRQELLDAGKCYYLEDDQITDVGAPYIDILESIGDMRKLKFVLQIDEKTASRAGNITWLNFTVWTHADNIKRLWSPD